MFNRDRYIALCQRLGEAGLPLSLNDGNCVVRGYADLGFEEFYVLPSGKLVSAVSGTVSDLPPEHKHFFFWCPTSEQLQQQLAERGIDILRIESEDQRRWDVTVKSQSTESTVSADSIQEALAIALLEFNCLATNRN